MDLRLVYYAIPRKNCHFVNEYLNGFKNEMSKNIPDFSNLEIIDGEDKYNDTYRFINHLIKPMIRNSEVLFNHLIGILGRISFNNFQSIKDEFPTAYEFFERDEDIDKNKMSESLRFKTLICVEEEKLRFKENACAHGFGEHKGRYAVVIMTYKNIIWHEVAHLFGADDHYIENDVYKMKEECMDKEFCVMQYEPADKPCSFCDTALKEIKDDMYKEYKPFYF